MKMEGIRRDINQLNALQAALKRRQANMAGEISRNEKVIEIAKRENLALKFAINKDQDDEKLVNEIIVAVRSLPETITSTWRINQCQHTLVVFDRYETKDCDDFECRGCVICGMIERQDSYAIRFGGSLKDSTYRVLRPIIWPNVESRICDFTNLDTADQVIREFFREDEARLNHLIEELLSEQRD